MIEALVSFVVGLIVGRVWQIFRHDQQERALGAHLRILAGMAPSDSRIGKSLRIIADTLEGKAT